MNHGNRHMRYRKSVYRRRRMRVVLIVSGIVLGVLLLLFLFLGNLFFDKLNREPASKPDAPPHTETQPPLPFEAIRHVEAPLLATDGSTSEIYNRLETLIAEGHTALSISLTDANGTLLYRSTQAEQGDYTIRGTSDLSLAEVAKAAHADGVYLCGTYVLSAASEENALTRSVLLAESAAVIAEAFLDGMDDIVILAPDLPIGQQSELIRLVESIRAFAPNAVVGLSLPEAEIASPHATRIDTLAQSFDYLALDLGRFGEEDPVTFAEARMRTMLYYLLRYEMRVLLPSLPDADTNATLIDAVKSESLDNWMAILP